MVGFEPGIFCSLGGRDDHYLCHASRATYVEAFVWTLYLHIWTQSGNTVTSGCTTTYVQRQRCSRGERFSK
jgi:hypothetical protein